MLKLKVYKQALSVKSKEKKINSQLPPLLFFNLWFPINYFTFIYFIIFCVEYKEEYLKGLKVEKNQLIVYSKWMPKLVASIERANQDGQFKQKPLGPIGNFIFK